MPRRTHKKSRGGCAQCKKRHIKVEISIPSSVTSWELIVSLQCDETKPCCVNCVTAEAQCLYLSTKPVASGQLDAKPVENAVSTASSSETPQLQEIAEGTHLSWDLHDMQLLHHYCTDTYKTMTNDPEQQHMWQTTAVRIGFSYPFLLNEMLAIAALHKAACNPSQQDFYYTRATQLQSHALNGFNRMQRDVDESNCVPVLLFSALLGAHLLGDRSRIHGLGPGEHLDHILSCVRLMRSVSKLVLKDWTPFLQESEIAPLMKSENPQPPYAIPSEYRALDTLIQQSDLGQTSLNAYTAAIDRLYWLIALIDVPNTEPDTPRSILAWPVQLSDDYMLLLEQRRPEALIILLHYGVVLHYCRQAWAIGDSGALLIRAIEAQLGSYWKPWLQWPLQVIGSS
ncbi:MAG: hypothetical protein Q9220_002699 [cf. Caloplaca sp. 1 TL-2023]